MIDPFALAWVRRAREMCRGCGRRSRVPCFGVGADLRVRPQSSVPFRAVLAFATLCDDRATGQACLTPTFGPRVRRARATCLCGGDVVVFRCRGGPLRPPAGWVVEVAAVTWDSRAVHERPLHSDPPHPPGTCNVPLRSEPPHLATMGGSVGAMHASPVGLCANQGCVGLCGVV